MKLTIKALIFLKLIDTNEKLPAQYYAGQVIHQGGPQNQGHAGGNQGHYRGPPPHMVQMMPPPQNARGNHQQQMQQPMMYYPAMYVPVPTPVVFRSQPAVNSTSDTGKGEGGGRKNRRNSQNEQSSEQQQQQQQSQDQQIQQQPQQQDQRYQEFIPNQYMQQAPAAFGGQFAQPPPQQGPYQQQPSQDQQQQQMAAVVAAQQQQQMHQMQINHVHRVSILHVLHLFHLQNSVHDIPGYRCYNLRDDCIHARLTTSSDGTSDDDDVQESFWMNMLLQTSHHLESPVDHGAILMMDVVDVVILRETLTCLPNQGVHDAKERRGVLDNQVTVR
ncbi:unnamed protein product [Caenorhabditis brenneri]